jgi:predicted amidohydrolase YtcJ
MRDAEYVFTGGRILTMDRSLPVAETVVLGGGRILEVGGRELCARHPRATVIDLHGRTLVPGFIDAHNHLSIAALHPLWADLSAVGTQEALAAALHAQATREREAGWIRAANWNEVDTGLLLDRHTLDALGFDRPVVVAHYSLHQCVVSSHALDLLGIGRTTPDPPGGVIAREADGSPSGLLMERAWSAAHAASMTSYRDPDRWADLFAARGRALLRDGITCVHDAACGPLAEAVYREMRRTGSLPISVLIMPHAEAILAGYDAARLDGPPTGDGDEWLRVGPMKLFADGGIAPAMDVSIGGVRGTPFGIAFDDLTDAACRVVERGFGLAVHAIGNVGLANALETFRTILRRRGDAERRFRIEHASLASPAQIDELARLGAVAVVQPGFVDHIGRAVENVPFDEEIWLPFGELLRRGVPLAGSSDDPCAFHEPLRCASHGVTRRTGSGGILGPEQAVGMTDWLRAYTIGAAYAGGQESERGSLAPGKRADLVVLAGDLDAERAPTVAETWVAGQRVFSAT